MTSEIRPQIQDQEKITHSVDEQMGTHIHHEKARKMEIEVPTWDKFRDAVGTFADDLGLVGSSETPTITPFTAPLGLDEDKQRQYNLTQISEDMTEEQFMAQLLTKDTLNIACMDKDASGPAFQNLTEDQKQKRMHFFMAGGAAQVSENRFNALRTMVQYLADPGKTGHMKNIYFTGHDNTCGYIKYELGGTSLPDLIGSKAGSKEEDEAMKRLILLNAEETGALEGFGDKLILGIEQIDRNGKVVLDTDFDQVKAGSLQEIVQTAK